MRKLKQNGGFTLVELLVAMATGVLIFMAASTILLLGLRINNLTTGTIIRQNTTSTMMKLLDRLATEGKIVDVEGNEESWTIYSKREGDVETRGVIIYNSETGEICTGTATNNQVIWDNNNPFMQGIVDSKVTIDEKGLLTLEVETEDGEYRSSVYCRNMALPTEDEEDYLGSTEGPRRAFLDILYGQYRMKGGQVNPGVILDSQKRSTGQYYSEWYIVTSEGTSGQEKWNSGEWNKATPWCACYVSYCLDQLPDGMLTNTTPKYANVDDFIKYFDGNAWIKSKANGGTTDPTAGDIIFFDWLMGTNPSHVGVVLSVSGDKIYTIEGNSAGMIAVRQYSLSDKRIIGYGVLPWAPSENP